MGSQAAQTLNSRPRRMAREETWKLETGTLNLFFPPKRCGLLLR